ncbi:MAG: ribonuclease P protein component [Candidatus Doudnabacteria bacterium RIFCSPHIGHO2_01_FULL_50_11]|uniref:Ribonuclease P protein component n=1 Tax=Candidatus Doudnabacteria bacterium RIFCSPHIGHO2_01_FULL_50_11 TaxID=1817828 RepID=A0A1F5PGB2_9BACT|nr:MAG: ribonuclease P protein component [Candidatus Doudnabacteria bacterium RIFCSPHIGHO2_01_FULL_50_11]
MLSKKYRIVQERDIMALLRSRSITSPLFRIHTKPNQLFENRFGFLISKKISSKTTQRNRMKRQLRNIIARLIPQIRAGIDCIVVVRRPFLTKSYQEIEGEIQDLLFKIGLLQKEIRSTRR